MKDLQQAPTATFLESGEGKRRLLVFVKGRHANEPLENRAKSNRLTQFATTSLLCIAALMIVAVVFAYMRGKL